MKHVRSNLLKDYGQKRHFSKTAEPIDRRVSDTGLHRFVIQKHAASHLHYDFRIELGGVLKSWAVPKGMPLVKGEKRLAMEVEAHPVDYLNFEGTIPKGEYGGGTVMIWDFGTFEPLSANPARELADGRLHFRLNGKKLRGEWHLVRMHGEKQWLLIRGKAEGRTSIRETNDSSAVTGRTMSQISTANNNVISKRPEGLAAPGGSISSKSSRAPAFVQPMKARLVDSPPDGDWIFEVKLDGFRAIAIKQNGNVRLLSRNAKDFGMKFPEVLSSLRAVPANDAVIDGEIAALDAKGRSDFQLLQAYDLGTKRPPLFFYAFDLLWLNGKDLRKEPLTERKDLLARLLKDADATMRFSPSLEGPAGRLLKEADKLGLEGLIGKRKESCYEAGRRSGAWIKLKLHYEQEMVIGGYTDPEGGRNHFGALLIGYYAGKRLKFAGKVGTGFNESLLNELHERFRKIGRTNCPFEGLPETKRGQFGGGLTISQMRRCHWLKPELVCQIKFSEWTRDGKLRQPVFLGLRNDKAAHEVIREEPE